MGAVGQEFIPRIISDQGHQSLHSIVSNLQGSKSDGEKKVSVEIQGEKKVSVEISTDTFFSPIKLKLVSTLSRK